MEPAVAQIERVADEIQGKNSPKVGLGVFPDVGQASALDATRI